MKMLIYLLIFSVLSIGAFSQEVRYRITFDRNNGAWVSSGNSAVEEYQNGKLILQRNPAGKMVKVVTTVVLDPSRDFSIISNIKSGRGLLKKPFGMVLTDDRFTGKSKHYFFKMFAKQGFEISLFNSSDSTTNLFFPRQNIRKLINVSPEFNKIELKNSGGVWEYFINDQKVWGKKDPGICISRIGFFSEGKQEVQVDDLVIKQDGWHNINRDMDSSKVYRKENLGENVNSALSELAPIISADGKTLYLVVKGAKGDEIWYSTLDPGKGANKRMKLVFPQMKKPPGLVCYVSPDNNSLLVNGCYDKSGNFIEDGLSVSNLAFNGWSIPIALKIKGYYNRNQYIGGVAYSPSGKTLILAIERGDTFGGLDLYVSFKKEDGNWSEPRNMGPDINTFGSESTPFLAADNATLYFSTDSRAGYGFHDIFMTRRLDETWTRWSEPKNLGAGINTPDWDAYFTIPASGDFCYLTSTENSLGKGDIFRIKISDAVKPNPVALIKGQVYNQKTKTFLETNITYKDLETNQEMGIALSNPVDGTYQISLPSGHKYSYLAEKEGFISVNENIDLVVIESYTEITKNLFLAPIEKGEIIPLNNVFFDYDKSELLNASVFELDRLVKIMNDNPTMVIEISGHTDNLGNDAYNQKLSEDRARAVYLYLKEKNLGARVSSIGYGKSKPMAKNDTEEGRAQNRRVEFLIIDK